ncbi:hypothetical protein FXO38_19759 [Capsicum annuum]|nr:hypothetical protein FXO38_19759 [Capsicum annuum]KAF3680020.1 hypothetical protein FXO37_03540 [Capsicum annuum]
MDESTIETRLQSLLLEAQTQIEAKVAASEARIDTKFQQLSQQIETFICTMADAKGVEVGNNSAASIQQTSNTSEQLDVHLGGRNNNRRQQCRKRLIRAEMAARRAKGLCYNYDDTYVQGHQCKKLLWLEIQNAKFEDVQQKIIYIASRLESEDVPTNSGEPAISLHAITRKQHVDAMQLQAVIDKKLLLSLVGSGSTHNFISSTAAQRLDLPIQRRRNLYASVANGEKISSLGICMVVQFSVANHSFNVDLYVIPLDAFDIVLGIKWLQTLDPILWDFALLTMSFQVCLLGVLVIIAYVYYQELIRWQKDEIEKQCDQMLQQGIIRPSHFPFSSPILLLDLRSGYHQVRMDSAYVEKTAFRTHHGHFEFLVMPFRLTNAPSTFQALMNESWKDHLVHIRLIFELLQAHRLYLKKFKCSFGENQVAYLGYTVSNIGVSVDAGKIEAVMYWPRPQSTTVLRGFLGLTGYYRKFIKNYSLIVAPLISMLKRHAFKWNDDALASFEILKKALVAAPVLQLPNFIEEFVECDASGVGIGAILQQQGHPIAFF